MKILAGSPGPKKEIKKYRISKEYIENFDPTKRATIHPWTPQTRRSQMTFKNVKIHHKLDVNMRRLLAVPMGTKYLANAQRPQAP